MPEHSGTFKERFTSLGINDDSLYITNIDDTLMSKDNRIDLKRSQCVRMSVIRRGLNL